MSLVLVLHPGAMGSSVAAAAATNHDVAFCNAGRSEATTERATDLGLQEFESLASAIDVADVVVSVCPPAAAVAVATEVGSYGFAGLYIDANAVAATTVLRARDAVPRARFVDGGIVGLPAWSRGTTRLYLSGALDEAAEAEALFAESLLEAINIGSEVGQASALKMAYAGWTKGSSALLLAMAAFAEHAGVGDALLAEWSRSIPGLEDRLHLTAAGTAPKAWRFVGEMDEIAKSLAAAGLPSGFHEGASEVYSKMANGVADAEDGQGDAAAVCRAVIDQLLS